MSILQAERETYQAIWQVEAYAAHSPGELFLPIFLDVIQTSHGTVLDAGCGSGRGLLALHRAGFDVFGCDLTLEAILPEVHGGARRLSQACLWHDLKSQLGYVPGGKFDYVYCCDVLEHIPLPFTMLVVRNLLAMASKGVFLTISLQADSLGVWIGKTLHQSVQSFSAWRDQLAELGHVKESRDLLMTGIYFLEPR